METLEFVQKPVDGKLVIELPEGWQNREVTVRITDSIPNPKDWADLPGKELVQILKRFKGAAKYPDTPTDKYEVYEQ